MERVDRVALCAHIINNASLNLTQFPPVSLRPPFSSLSPSSFAVLAAAVDGRSTQSSLRQRHLYSSVTMADITALLPPSLNLPPHLSAHKYFFVCTLTVAAWDTLVLSPRTWRLMKTPEWPLLKIIFHFLCLFMLSVSLQSPSIRLSHRLPRCDHKRDSAAYLEGPVYCIHPQ